MHTDPDIETPPPPLPPQPQPNHAPSSSSSSSSAPPGRLLFVEVRGPRNRRQPGLLYDRSASELKSHVMLVHSKEKRQASDRDRDRDYRRQLMRVVGAANDNSKKKLTVVLTTLAPEMGEQYNDPFDTLPVQSTPEVHAAIRHYFEHYPGPTPFTHDSLVYDKNAYKREKMEWSQVQFSFCQDQKIAYLIMLFIWQVMKNLGREMNYETSKYWAVVLRVTREEMPIGKTGTDIPESYVAMIAGLGVAETWLGNFANARQHMEAMLQLVAARGGFSTFCAMGQRALTWCEFYPCACLELAPRLPRTPVRPLHPDILAATERAHRRTVALLPPRLVSPGSPLGPIFFGLHVCVGEWESPVPTFTGVLDDLEHRILVELAREKEKRAAAGKKPAGPMDVVYYALLQACQMCVFGSMPFTRKEAPMYGVFAETLRRVLLGGGGAVVPDDDEEEEEDDVVGTWTAVASAESLLWVLFIGWSTASQLNGDAPGAVEIATWFLRQFAAAVEVLGLTEVAQVHNVMRQFPWGVDTYRAPLDALWDIYQHREDLNIT
ncbi:hypothetical protein SLS55_002016 [Diplodia seriata]|uniref:Uncharacterized protein n=1 Tax=Diplodia seriata TaxID=420778 RepID=A0ABR3CRU7_9PEZI